MIKKLTQTIFVVITILFMFVLTSCSTSKLEFQKDTYVVAPNDSIEIGVNIFPKKNGYSLSIENTAICSISGNTITGIKEGITNIYAISDDGKKEAQARIVVSKDIDKDNPVVINPSFLVLFYIVDEEGNTETYKSQYYEVDTTIDELLPTYVGYDITGWFSNLECTESYNIYSPIKESLSLYCKKIAKDNSFNFDNNHYVESLFYKNLPHSVLYFPEKTNTGAICLGIKDGAFMGDTSIEEIYIPSSYEYIGNLAFAGCTNLKKVVIDENSNLKTIGKFAFSVTRSKVDEDEETKEDEVEYELNDNPCNKLTSINLPDSVETIGSFAFYKCSSLVLEDLPSSLKIVNQGTFYETKIKSANLENVLRILSYAFYGCSDLNTITNINKCVYIGKEAFCNCGYYSNQINNNGGIVYIEDVLVGVSDLYGRLLGGSKLKLKDETRLIANGTFTKTKNQYDLSIEFPADHYVDIGTDAFYTNVEGVALIIPEDYLDYYCETYSTYENLFCYIKDYTLTDDVNINYGTHRTIIFADGHFCYEKYIPLKNNNDEYIIPKTIDLSRISAIHNCYRIQTHAIDLSKIPNALAANLDYVNLGRINNIAYLAICNCPNLKIIDLSDNPNI
nr:leucine-rich repeat domain-containing protein [Clostridia bacterium]